MDTFFESYFYEDEFINVEGSIFEILKNKHPNLQKCYEYIAPELEAINNLRDMFMKNHKLVISFHPYYMLYKNIQNPSLSIRKSKDRFLKSNLSFSISSKSKTLLVDFEDGEFVYIPKSLKNKMIQIQPLDEFKSSTASSIFHTKKPTKGELIPLINELIKLNNKLDVFNERKIPFTFSEHSLCWSRVFFQMK